MAQTGFDFEKPITAIETELEKLRESLRKKTDALREKEAKEREKKIAELEKRLSDTAKLTDEAAKLSDTAKFTAELTAAQEPISERTPEQVDADLAAKIRNAEARLDAARTEIYAKLTPWQRVQIARHPARPHALDYIHRLFSDWTELSGDRHFGDDKAVVAGFGRFKDQPVAVIGQQKGVDTKDNILRNFGMMHPEGYRKAMRVMKTAEKFGLPIIILIDTPGAYPGIGAE
ncbi:hypothetical protein HY256_00540, partial [Candidatus Sumerlaeota bacterium]|nr:hypothetical protein [Candidatus Sumerlaeota bacterium]